MAYEYKELCELFPSGYTYLVPPVMFDTSVYRVGTRLVGSDPGSKTFDENNPFDSMVTLEIVEILNEDARLTVTYEIAKKDKSINVLSLVFPQNFQHLSVTKEYKPELSLEWLMKIYYIDSVRDCFGGTLFQISEIVVDDNSFTVYLEDFKQ